MDLIEASLKTIDANGAGTTAVGTNADAANPFNASRLPLVADFTFNGQTITVINNHFSSKGGSGALMGDQPPFNSAEDARAEQAQAVNTFVDSLLAANAKARVVISGDLNEFEFEEPMHVLEGTATYLDGPDADLLPEYTVGGAKVLNALVLTLPANQQYDYVFAGNSQSLDQMYASAQALNGVVYDIVHINSEFANQASDHDALVGSFDMAALTTTPSNALTFTLKSSLGTAQGLVGAEISAFDPGSDRLFVTSNAGLEVINLSNPSAPSLITTINFTTLGFSVTDVTSVAVKNGIVAVALPDADKALPGKVVFLDAATNALLGSVTVGALPDMLTFTPDGTKVLVANEGEMKLNATDGDGTVSIINLANGVANATVQTATFTAFNGQEAALRAQGVRIFEGRSVSQDVEPEYIAIAPDGLTAMVTLQEANAVAILNIATATFTSIVPLGQKDFSGLLLDTSDRDGPSNTALNNLQTGLPVFGLYMPDAIDTFQANGQTYYVIANEGDDRDDFLTTAETIRAGAGGYDLDNTTFPTEATLKTNAQLARLTVSNSPGLRGDTNGDGDIDQILMYGARSFSILDSSGQKVFDSADIIERIVSTQFPALFDDTRSDNKGPEPEGIEIGVVNGKTYAFVGLERSHMTLAFDITDPNNVVYTGAAQRAGDLNPEGQLFISAADSPSGVPLLVTSNEVSNNISVFSITQPAAYTLQLLHYYGESGLLGTTTAARMGALIDKFDDQYANTLVLGEGDSFIPGPWLVGGADPSLNAVPGIGSTALGRPDIAIMNAFGTDASALGNHEFDLGSPVLQGAFVGSGAWAGAQFPFITANLNFSADSSLRGIADATLGGTGTNAFAGQEVTAIKAKIAPYAISTQGGEKIGIVGATTYDLLSKTSPNGTVPKDDGNISTDDLQEVAAYIQAAVDALKALGVNKIVMIDQLDTIERNKLLAPLVNGIDVMIAGGGHERLGDANDTAVGFNGHTADFVDTYPIVVTGSDGKPMLIVTTDTEYTYLGRLVVDFDAQGNIILGNLDSTINGAYAATEANLQAAYGTNQTADQIVASSTIGAKVDAITDAINAIVIAKDSTVWGYTDVYMEGDRAFGRAQEVNLGDVTADANILVAQNALPSSLFMTSLKNGDGIRASIGAIDEDGTKIGTIANPSANKPAGGISTLDIENALRFDNKLMVFDTTPAGLKAILEHGAGLAPGNGGYPQLGGLRISYDPDNAAGSKVVNVSVIDLDGNVIARVIENGVISPDAPATIQMVSLNFTANGGDGYPIKANADNFRYILDNNTLSAPISEALDFTAAGNIPANTLGEQVAFQRYLQEFHSTPEDAYNQADTPASQDIRIQNLNAKTSDTVFTGKTLNGTSGVNDLDGTAGNDILNAAGGDDDVSGGAGPDAIDLGDGADLLHDTLAHLRGDTIAGFGTTDTLRIEGEQFDREDATIVKSGTGASITLDGDTFNFTGNFTNGDFMFVADPNSDGTLVTFEPFLPTLADGAAVSNDLVNGITNPAFLTGDGETAFEVAFKSSSATMRNSLGYYEVAPDGTISDVHILFANTKKENLAGAIADLGVVEDGTQIGFFLVVGGGGTVFKKGAPDDLAFRTAIGGPLADLDSGAVPVLTSSAKSFSKHTLTILHSFETLNAGDVKAVISGVVAGGTELSIGFEDRAGSPIDNDFQDFVIGVRAIHDTLV